VPFSSIPGYRCIHQGRLAVFFQITIDADALVVEVSYSQATVEIRVSFYRNAVGLGSVRYFFKEKYFFRKHRPGLGFL
jgi:hypothetical protein